MLSIYKWATAKDETPERPSYAIAKPEKKSDNMNGVTYASKDEGRNIQFVCHLPPGSQHASKAQELAGSIYSGRPVASKNRLASSPREPALLEDVQGQQRRVARSEAHPRAKKGRHSREGLVVLEAPNPQPSSAPRHTTRTAGWQAHAEEVGRSTGNIPHTRHHKPLPESVVSSNKDGATDAKAGQGFRHEGSTHTTYNIKRGDRQLFVAAPTGSVEDDVHNKIARMAAKGGSDRKIEDQGKKQRWLNL